MMSFEVAPTHVAVSMTPKTIKARLVNPQANTDRDVFFSVIIQTQRCVRATEGIEDGIGVSYRA